MTPRIRISTVNDGAVAGGGGHVLYWMNAYRRLGYNHALERAAELARELRKPLVILEALRCDYPFASPRHSSFIMDGMREHALALRARGVAYYPYVERAPGEGKGLVAAMARDAAVVVTDDWPCFFLPRAVAAAGAQVAVKMEKVDSAGLLPLRATDRAFPMAFGFRSWLMKNLRPHLDELPVADPLVDLPPSIRVQGLDRWTFGVPEGPSTAGGTVAGRARWRQYLASGVDEYADTRDAPTSKLSPYLHYGHLSSFEMMNDLRLRRRSSWDALMKPRDGKWGWHPAFVDQLVTWREIGLNMCARRTDYREYESLPEWARKTLEKHAGDPRAVYPDDVMERAETADPIWNATQRQLLGEGVIDSYLRMLWGKKILEWTPGPREALALMLRMNDQYALDGRDPNSYSGIFWVLGRYDRPWPERPIYGMVRTMSSASTKKKLDLNDYLLRWGPS